MAAKWKLFGGITILFAMFVHYLLRTPVYLEQVPLKTWGLRSNNDIEIRKFEIPTPSAESVSELKNKISSARIPTQSSYIVDHEPSHGITSSAVSRATNYWMNEFDWDTSPAINSLKQLSNYETIIGGLRIHFIHEKPQINQINTLCFTINDAKDGGCYVFEVIAPSLPGYGFSDGANIPGLSALDISRIMITLMEKRLFFKEYYVQGGDWGSVVATGMAQLSNIDMIEYNYKNKNKVKKMRPNVLGIHINMYTPASIGAVPYFSTLFLLSPDEKECEFINEIQNQDVCENYENQLNHKKLVYHNMNEMFKQKTYEQNDSEKKKKRNNLKIRLFEYLFPNFDDRERICHSKLNSFSSFIKHSLGLTGYFHILATRPDTLGLGFHDSPIALTAWILEKMAIWTHQPKCEFLNTQNINKEEEQEKIQENNHKKASLISNNDNVYDAISTSLGHDWLIANLAIYWYSDHQASPPLRLYKNSAESINFMTALGYQVPGKVAIGDYPKEILRFPYRMVKTRFPNLVYFVKQKLGGHFAALEQPRIFANDVLHGIHAMELA